MKKYITLIVVSAGILFTASVSAQFNPDTLDASGLMSQERAAEFSAGFGAASESSIQTAIGRIINYATGLIGTILFVLIVYGAYQWMTAAGNDDQVTKAKETIQRGIIGVLIILAAYAITQFIVNATLYSTTEYRNNSTLGEWLGLK